MAALHPILRAALDGFTRRRSSAGETIERSSKQKPTPSLPPSSETSATIPTKSLKLPSATSSRCASMHTPDSSTQHVEAVVPSEQPKVSEPTQSSESSQTPNTPLMPDKPSDRVVATYDGNEI